MTPIPKQPLASPTFRRGALVAYLLVLFGPLSPAATTNSLSLPEVRANKLLYAPGEPGKITLPLHNPTTNQHSGQIRIVLLCELADAMLLAEQTVSVGPGENRVLEFPFTAKGRFGNNVRATWTSGDTVALAEDYFSVSAEPFEVGIGSSWGGDLHTGRGKHRDVADKMRKIYSNLVELFFWAPCDWSRLVSPFPVWWSGQADYPESEANTLELIRAVHAQGMKIGVYANCNPAGPFAWETARQHPEWFFRSGTGGISGEYHTEYFDKWNDPAWRNVKGERMGETGWYRANVDLRQPAALDHGIDEIIASAKHYGWDFVRFDGHYTILGQDPLSTHNMRRLKERVWAEVAGLRFGFNYGRAPEWRNGVTHEMREAMAGDGLYMQEGIRAWWNAGDKYERWSHYATNELRIAKQVQAMGGHYHCLWDLSHRIEPAQAIYKLVYGLIAGGHPYYDYHQTPGCPNWGAFMTRWSAFLWDRALRPVAAVDDRLSVTAGDALFWKPLVQERVADDGRRYLVVHLVNPPSSDQITETTLPPPVEKVTVTLRKGWFQTIPRAVLVQPEAAPFDTPLKIDSSGGRARVTVPRLTHWAMVIFELPERGRPPAPAPRFTAPPDPAQVAAGRQAAVTARIVDPNKGAEAAELGPDEQVWETDSGYSGVPAFVETLPDATGGLAQVKTWKIQTIGHSQRFMGRSWLGPLAPGRYRAQYRIKWLDSTASTDPHAWRVHAYVDIHNKETAVDYLTPNCWEEGNERFAALMGGSTPPARFRKLPPPGEWHYVPVEFDLRAAGYVNACLIVDTDRDGPQKFYLDHIKTERVEPYRDADLEPQVKLAKPAGLRTPAGQSPSRCLVVRGLHWATYLDGRLPEADAVYELPPTHAALYTYDCVVLANLNVTMSAYEARQVLRDWVVDGGRLVVLGGSETLGQGGMRHTFFEDLLPVTMRGPFEVVRCDPPLTLRTGGRATGDESPVLFWRHAVTVRDKAVVLAHAGEQPVAVRGEHGAGMVYVFTGTPLGVGDAAHPPFWSTGWWTGLLAQMIGR